MQAALSTAGVGKRYGATQALDAVSLAVASGTVHGLVGGNGSGKSTLVKVLAGVIPGATGEVRVGEAVNDAGRVTPGWAAAAGLRFVHQDMGVFPDLTVAENLALGHGFATARGGRIRWREVRGRAERLIAEHEINADADERVAELSPGDRALVAIARALQDEDAQRRFVLVLDEPTACLPARETQRLLDVLRGLARAGHAVILVSHRLSEIVSVADAVSVLRDGRHVRTCERGFTEHDLVELISGEALHALPDVRRGTTDRLARAARLEVTALSVGPVRDVSFTLRGGEILGIAGLLGSGRSTMMKALFGAVTRRSGTVRVDGEPVSLRDVGDALAAGFAYVPENRVLDGAFTDMTVLENLSAGQLGRYWRRLALRRGEETRDARAAIDAYGIRVRDERQPLGTLSGGNQQKVVLARALRAHPRVLLLDEPTQGVDVRARAEIHRLVRQAVDEGLAVLIISSDFEELAAVADRTLVLRGGTVVAELTAAEATPAHLNQLAFTNPVRSAA